MDDHKPTELVEQLYQQLRRAAQVVLQGERTGHTLSATALVHEAYLRLGQGELSGPAEYYVAATNAMRRILIDHARARTADKRGGMRPRVSLDGVSGAFELATEDRCEEILILDDALSRLEVQDARLAQIVRLRFYSGLENKEIAQAVGISEATVKREWSIARAMLFRLLSDDSSR